MGNIANLSNSAVLVERGDLEIILRALTAFQQASSEAAEILLRRLDDIDGDPDLSPDGDELDGSLAEDDFSPKGTGISGPGCPLSDPGEDDNPAEEDDAAGQYDEDCYTGPKPKGDGPGCTISDPDFCAVERGELTTHESFIQGCGSAPHEDDDDEPRRGPAIMEGEGFTYREVR